MHKEDLKRPSVDDARPDIDIVHNHIRNRFHVSVPHKDGAVHILFMTRALSSVANIGAYTFIMEVTISETIIIIFYLAIEK